MILQFCARDSKNFRLKLTSIVGYAIVLQAIMDQYTFTKVTWEIGLITCVTIIQLMGKERLKSYMYLAIFGFGVFSVCLLIRDLFRWNVLPLKEATLQLALPLLYVPFLLMIFFFEKYRDLFKAIDRKIKSPSYKFLFKIGVLLHCRFNDRRILKVKYNMHLIEFQSLPPVNAVAFLLTTHEFDPRPTAERIKTLVELEASRSRGDRI